MRSWAFGLALLLGHSLPSLVFASGALYKCVDRRGAVSIQDTPCTGSTQTQSVTPVEVDPQARSRQGRLYQADSMDRVAQRRNRRATRVSQCEQVRAQVADERDREGLTASFDRRSQWDERVRQSCK